MSLVKPNKFVRKCDGNTLKCSELASLHMQVADDLFGTPQGSPRTGKLIDASIQWAERIMSRIDEAQRRTRNSDAHHYTT